jgi:ankyrin repeat protein
MAHLFLEHGADSTVQNKDGWTPLCLAVRSGRVNVVHFFLERGVDVTTQRKDGPTLLHLASRWGHVEVARFFQIMARM